ncbi:Diacylglycerol kinase [hydrothermal vent metagenome]|uniref:Diacylglycerol kinase n=1 Tax=hydrothermal vent metagenome TaxID=652676 RepID=A0A1W1EJX1_9ZZZZ
MTNKPKYHLFNNTTYALNGLKIAIKDEKSFQIEVVIFIILQIGIFILPIENFYQMILSSSLFLVIIAELVNSAIERVVDLVTTDIHPLAKEAKDLGSSVVFMTIMMIAVIWGFVGYMILI